MTPRPGDKFFLMFGSALTMPVGNSRFGVPGTDAMVEMIRTRLDRAECAQLDRQSNVTGKDRYQSTMAFFEALRGKQAVNDLVAEAVGCAFKWYDPPAVLNAL